MINELERVCERHDHNTRNYVVPKPNLVYLKRCLTSFRFSGAQVWNTLPENLQNVQSVDSFKHMYKRTYFV